GSSSGGRGGAARVPQARSARPPAPARRAAAPVPWIHAARWSRPPVRSPPAKDARARCALTAAEADVALAREALDVHDAAQRDEVLPVSRLESHDSVGAAGEGPLELIRGGGGHQGAH